MYPWIWRHLPGGTSTKAVLAVLLFAAACAVVLFVIYPVVEPHLPLNAVTVGP